MLLVDHLEGNLLQMAGAGRRIFAVLDESRIAGEIVFVGNAGLQIRGDTVARCRDAPQKIVEMAVTLRMRIVCPQDVIDHPADHLLILEVDITAVVVDRGELPASRELVAPPRRSGTWCLHAIWRVSLVHHLMLAGQPLGSRERPAET